MPSTFLVLYSLSRSNDSSGFCYHNARSAVVWCEKDREDGAPRHTHRRINIDMFKNFNSIVPIVSDSILLKTKPSTSTVY